MRTLTLLISRSRAGLLRLGLSLLAALAALGSQAFADEQGAADTVFRGVPFAGTLARDGQPFSGKVTLTFQAFAGRYATSPVWAETQAVTVVQGRYEVLLGAGTTDGASATTLAALLRQGQDLYVAVAATTPEGAVAFAGRHRLLPASAAHWASTATGLRIGGGLLVEGSAASGGPGDGPLVVATDAGSLSLDADDVRSSGALTLGGNGVSAGAGVLVRGGSITLTGPDGTTGRFAERVLLGSLHINPDKAFGNRVTFDSPVTFTAGVSGVYGIPLATSGLSPSTVAAAANSTKTCTAKLPLSLVTRSNGLNQGIGNSRYVSTLNCAAIEVNSK